jgi:uncharacterized ParB-like nuclease family protein
MNVTLRDDDLEVLPIAVLQVDRSYQRDEREHLIRKILADGFDMNAAYPIIVSERPPVGAMSDHRYFIVDGQHRTVAAERDGETEVIAKIVRFQGSEAKIIQQEAALRTKMGERKPDTPMERFKAKLRSGNDTALRIDSMVESFGGRAGEASMLDAIAWLLQKHPDVDTKHLIRRLRGTPPEAVHARATAIQSGMGGSLWKNYYRAMLEFYNQRAPAKTKRLTPIDF